MELRWSNWEELGFDEGSKDGILRGFFILEKEEEGKRKANA